MLLSVLQEKEAGGFVVIQDTASYSGRQLLKYYINCAIKSEEIVHVLGFEVPEQEIRKGLDRNYVHLFHFHNAYSDPLGWTKQSSFRVKHFTTPHIIQLVNKTQNAKATILVIDSLSWVLRHHNPAVICQELQKLKREGSIRMTFGLLHKDLHQQGIVGSICHLASTVISVAPLDIVDSAVAKTTQRKKSGKVMQEDNFFSIKDDLILSIQNKPSQSGHVKADLDTNEGDPASNLTFNLRLSEAEREAKEKVALPFVFSQEKKSALLRPSQSSGQIMYEPDASDDFDEEDPDDDLDV
ncbi:elongator complex protein 5 isoform X2 [Electrophorus electricus]|uniref:elongator complex protein 5 isoform X2 n=1 Tax=Electrophorus electricus TaxID=8005 RepID=UPI0015D0C3F3|nr:elongator complex protein 5 isoform X2 [Electrophorus electricus]